MNKRLVNPASMGRPLSNYSHAVTVQFGEGTLIFVTGQIAVDASGNVVAEHDAGQQAEYVFARISQILAAAGASLADVVKATIFVTDMDEFPQVAEVRDRLLAQSSPASTFVEVARLVLPGAKVEIEVVAAIE